MNLICHTDPETGTLKLTGDMNIYQFEPLKNALIEPIKLGGDLSLDLSEVESCDFTGLQLLVAAARSVKTQGCQLRIESPSAAFNQALTQLGIAADFNLSV